VGFISLNVARSFGDFFDTPLASSAAPHALGFDGFFKGAFSYHFHNYWFVPRLFTCYPLFSVSVGGSRLTLLETGQTSVHALLQAKCRPEPVSELPPTRLRLQKGKQKFP
jgi:hypothetical protein